MSEGKQLDVTAARLAAIVASSDDAIVSKDLNGTILTWNAAAERLFGYTAEEAVGRHITLIIPEDRHSEETHVITQVRAGIGVAHYETIRRHKDGTLLNISLTVSPVRDRDGNVVAASKIARDITEHKRLQRQAEEASRAKDQFLATLSHELRTPLNTLTGYIMMLRQGKMDPAQQARALDVMARNAEALTGLVSDLLDSSQVATGRIRLDLRSCDLSELVSEGVESIRPSAELKQLHIEATIPPQYAYFGDPDRLRQVLWNVLTNAVKFTPARGRISVALVQRDGYASITVSDTGIGIPEDALPRVFQRFWQEEMVSRNGSKGGLGLGLALARHFVELHGGTIKAESSGRETGATFTIELPTRAAAPL